MAAKRGPSYPLMGLPEAIDRARALYAQDGTARTQQDVAVRAWGYGSLNGTSLRVIAALKHYGLLESSDDGVKLTDRATAILLEEAGSTEWVHAVNDAAEAPVMFRTILTEFGGNLPSDAAIVSYLVRKQGFVESAAQNLVTSLRETIDFTKQTNQRAPAENASGRSPIERGRGEDARGDSEIVRQKSSVVGQQNGERMEYNWPLSGNAVATLVVSRPLLPDDIEVLSDYLKIAKRVLASPALDGRSPGGGTVADPNHGQTSGGAAT